MAVVENQSPDDLHFAPRRPTFELAECRHSRSVLTRSIVLDAAKASSEALSTVRRGGDRRARCDNLSPLQTTDKYPSHVLVITTSLLPSDSMGNRARPSGVVIPTA